MKVVMAILALCVLAANTLLAQDKMEPSVVFLYPAVIHVPEEIKDEIAIYEKEILITEELEKSYVQDNLAPNWKTIRKRELTFIQQQELITLLVLTLARELTYKEVEYHENLLIYPIKESAGDKVAYKKVTDQLGMSWLVNIPRVSLLTQDNLRAISVDVQLYNPVTNRLFIDQTFTLAESSAEPCEEGIWYCMVQTINKEIAVSLAHQIDKNRQYHR